MSEIEEHKKIYSEVIDVINNNHRFMCVAHVNPEGDALGSLLGVYHMLKGMGKEVVPYLEDEVPDILEFLPGSKDVVHDLSNEAPFDVTIGVDCGNMDRFGKRFVEFGEFGTIVNLDHHVSNDMFGHVNVVLPKACASGEVVYDLCRAMGEKVTPEIATVLYTAIETDTGSFRYESTSPEALRKAGELVAFGADPWNISENVYENYPAKKHKLLAKVLDTLEVMDGGIIATLRVTPEMQKETGAGTFDSDGFVNYARSIRGVDVGLLVRTEAEGLQKVSLRSKGLVDVSKVAGCFGGGGHMRASGCMIKGTQSEALNKVVEEIKKTLK